MIRLTAVTVALCAGAAISSADAQHPDFSGEWIRAVDSASTRPTVAKVGDAAFRIGDMGSGWGSPLTIRQQANRIVLSYEYFTAYDLEPPVSVSYALDGSESRNTVNIGYAASDQLATVAWNDNSLVITTRLPAPPDDNGRPVTAEMQQTLTLESPTVLAVETMRLGVLGGATTTTRTIYTKR